MKTYSHNMGYLRVLDAGDLSLQHRYVVEQAIGRKLLPSEVVHHKNGDKTDNRLDNLEVMTRAEHSRIHASQQVKQFSTLKCAWCASEFQKELRRVKYQSKIGCKEFFCSRSCKGASLKASQIASRPS